MGLLLSKLHLLAAFMFLFSAPGIYIAHAKISVVNMIFQHLIYIRY